MAAPGSRDAAASDGSSTTRNPPDTAVAEGPAEPDQVDGSAVNGDSDACPTRAARAVTRVRIYPAAGKESELLGVAVQGSNSGPTTNFVTLDVIDETPRGGEFVEIAFENEQLYRFVRLYADSTEATVAEVEFYRGGVKLEGSPFGTVGAESSDTGAFARAFDGDTATEFDARAARGSYVGLDLGADGLLAASPTFSLQGGSYPEPVEVTLASDTPDAVVRFTTDGKHPAEDGATAATGPVRVDRGTTTLRAIASAPCLFPSPATSATYVIGSTDAPGDRAMKSYHIGNSLTDTIQDYIEPVVESTGAQHEYTRWTIPGAPVGEIWRNKGVGFGTPEGAQNLERFAASAAPIDHLFVQPYSDPSREVEAGAAIEMYRAVRAHSPDVRLWIYAQWPPSESWSENALAIGAGWAKPSWSVPSAPRTWEEAAANQLLYHEAFRQWIVDRVPGKDVLIVPAGPALVMLKNAVEAGEVPGIRDFFAGHFLDDEHLNEKGQYFVTLVFYACMYQQSPEGRVTFVPAGVSDEQARVYQRIAWMAVQQSSLSQLD